MSSTPIVSVPVASQQTHFRLPECLGSNNATSVATGTKTIKYLQAFNGDTDACRLKIYDKATAPDPSTDTPLVVIMLPPAGGAWRDINSEIVCTIGIAFLLVKGPADTDNTAVTAGMVTDLEITYQ